MRNNTILSSVIVVVARWCWMKGVETWFIQNKLADKEQGGRLHLFEHKGPQPAQPWLIQTVPALSEKHLEDASSRSGTTIPEAKPRIQI